jgi:hypothetical protein
MGGYIDTQIAPHFFQNKENRLINIFVSSLAMSPTEPVKVCSDNSFAENARIIENHEN